MIVLILLAFVGMLTGIFLILGMTPFTFAEELTKPLSGRRQPISKRIQQVNHPKEPKGIRKTVLEAREMLILTGKGGKFAAICAFSLFLAAMGAVICIVIQNYFMLPVLAAGMGLLPFWYVLFTSHSYKKLMNNEIETGLSIITSSYLRSESIITAEEENIHYLNPPVADVFRGFLAETGMISADVKQALSNMKPKLDNYVFREWVDAAIACQDDKSLKSTLTPIIGKLSDIRIVAAELDYLMYEPFKEFITMAFLLVGNIAEILTLFVATLLNWDAPLLAVHILWVNLATATLPALALGVDPASKNIMKHPPVKSGTLFEKDLVRRVVTQGLFVAAMTTCAYWLGVRMEGHATGQTMAFCVLAFSQMLRAFNQRSNTEPIWVRSEGANPYLVLSFAISALLMAGILGIPALRDAFSLTLLQGAQWLATIALAALSLAQVELAKAIARHRKRSR